MSNDVHVCAHHARGEKHTCVEMVPIFNHLEQEQMNEIMQTAKSVTYKKGELIYRDGEESDALYILHEGRIRIYRLSESGKEQLVRILNPGDYTGEYALFRKETHVSYAEALGNIKICMIQRADIQQLLEKYPSISLRIMAEFSRRLDESEKQTTRFATEKVETRLALYLAECAGDRNEFELPMTKKDLASYLGTTPESLSRKFSYLETEGFIRQKSHRRIKVLDMDGLLLV